MHVKTILIRIWATSITYWSLICVKLTDKQHPLGRNYRGCW